MAATRKGSQDEVKVNEKKWGRPAVENGWTLLPNILLEKQAVLGISPTEMNVLLHILKHWWQAESLPFPEMNTIAKAMNVSRSTVQRSIRNMENAGLVQRIQRKSANGGNTSNMYDFSGLVKHLEPYAAEELKLKRAAKAEKAKRLTPKGNNPRLKVVK